MYFVVVIVIIFLIFVLIVLGRSSSSSKKLREASGDNEQIIKNAQKRLSLDPHDIPSLLVLSDAFFMDHDWSNTFEIDGRLIKLTEAHEGETENHVDLTVVKLQYGMAAFYLEKFAEAALAFTYVIETDRTVFEANYYMGLIKYNNGEHQRAFELFNAAHVLMPDHEECTKYLGITLFLLNQFVRAEAVLVVLCKQDPSDAEAVFYLARCYFELRQFSLAEQILEKISTNPEYGPHVALMTGKIYLTQQKADMAKKNFEDGLSYENIPPDLKCELQYQLATIFMELHHMSKAKELFQSICKENSHYKDSVEKLAGLKELSANENLQSYLIAGRKKFGDICESLCAVYFKHVKIMEVQFRGEYVDILLGAETNSKPGIILVRFVRSIGMVGDIVLRDMNSYLQDSKADRGVCVCAGSYSDTASSFARARFITLVSKAGLLKGLGKITL